MLKINTLWLLFFLMIGNSLFAGEYDLDAFLELVKQNSKDLKLAKQELKMADAVKKEAWASALPKVGAQGDYRRNLLENYLFVDFPGQGKQKFKISYDNEFSFNAALTQPLFSFKIGNALTAASQYQSMTDFIFTASEQAIVTFAKKGFYQLLLLNKVVEIAEASELSAKENYDNIKNKYDNGLVSEFELLQAEVAWKNKIPETMETKRNYDLLLANLKNFAGISEEQDLILIGNLETFPVKPDRVSTESVLGIHPEFQAMVWQSRLRETGVKAANADYFPTLDGSFVYVFSSQTDTWQLENRNNNFILGLSLTIPIYTGGYIGAQAQKAKVELEKARINIEKNKDDISNELTNIFLRLDEAEKRITSAKGTLNSAQKAFKIAEVSADNGLITQLELKDARIFNDQANLNYYKAVYDYLDAYFDWEKATGRVE
ncbi:MAG: TolC family protein [Calditrichaceae bacterium]|nr:TolC family protein [Calditrichaceae bacterium]